MHISLVLQLICEVDSDSSGEQLGHEFDTFFLHTHMVNKKLLDAGTNRAMSRNWTPSPTSASKKSKGSMASSLSLRRWFHINYLVWQIEHEMSRLFSPLCGSSWAIKLQGWSCFSTPSYSTASSLQSFTNLSWQNHAGKQLFNLNTSKLFLNPPLMIKYSGMTWPPSGMRNMLSIWRVFTMGKNTQDKGEYLWSWSNQIGNDQKLPGTAIWGWFVLKE